MESVLILLSSIGLSYLLNIILFRFSSNFGIDSRLSQNLIRWSTASKPTTGGISFFITFLVGFIALLIWKPGLSMGDDKYLALLASATLAFLIGFADDAYGTHPYLKLAGQIVCGVILVGFGIKINFFVVWSPELWILDHLLTIFWVVGLMNSLNMLDNMDGVTTSIALSILCIGLVMMVEIEGISNLFYLLIAIAGGFVGFLFLNWRPAKIYMGDTGSMFIGLLMAFVGIQYFWNIPASPDNISHWRTCLIPLMVFIVPIMDTSFVTFARISRGSSPFQGGRDHLTHNLVRIGVAEHLVPVTLAMVSIISGGMAMYVFGLIPNWDSFYSLLFTLYPVCVIALFLKLYRQGTAIEKRQKAIEEGKIEPIATTKIMEPEPRWDTVQN